MDKGRSPQGILFPEQAARKTAELMGVVVTSYSFTRTDKGWRLMIKAVAKNGKPKVAFMEAHEEADLYDLWYTALTTTHRLLEWYEDKYPKK